MHEAEIVRREELPSGESKLVVRIPELPETTPDKCTLPPRPEGSILTANWRWVIRDSWIRPAREHDYWAIPTPQNLPWKTAPATAALRSRNARIAKAAFIVVSSKPIPANVSLPYVTNSQLAFVLLPPLLPG